MINEKATRFIVGCALTSRGRSRYVPSANTVGTKQRGLSLRLLTRLL
jgi:hypothetical protein